MKTERSKKMLKGIEYIWKDRKRHLGMPLSFIKYAFSEDRLFVETGLFTIRQEEILLYRVRDLSMRITLWQRIFGVGTICVMSSDKTAPEQHLDNIKHPGEVKELLHNAVEQIKINRRVRIGELVGDGSNETAEADDPFAEMD